MASKKDSITRSGLSSRWHYRRDMAQLNGSLANAAHKRARSQAQGCRKEHEEEPARTWVPALSPPCAGALQSVSQQAMKLKFIDIVKIILTGIAK